MYNSNFNLTLKYSRPDEGQVFLKGNPYFLYFQIERIQNMNISDILIIFYKINSF